MRVKNSLSLVSCATVCDASPTSKNKMYPRVMEKGAILKVRDTGYIELTRLGTDLSNGLVPLEIFLFVSSHFTRSTLPVSTGQISIFLLSTL